jgi:hypothetical protein
MSFINTLDIYLEEERLKVAYVRYLNISRAYLLVGQYDVALHYIDSGEKIIFAFLEPELFLDRI